MPKANPEDAAPLSGEVKIAAVPKPEANSRKWAIALAFVIVALVAAFFGIRHLQFVLRHEETDDAEVEGDVSPVLPRISGYVIRILVSDDQHVNAGQPLIEIDARDLDLKAAEAAAALRSSKATLQNARALLFNARSAAAVARANVATAAVTQAKTAADLARDTKLYQTSAITDRDVTDSRAAADIARAKLEVERRQAESAETQIAVAQSQIGVAEAQVRQRQADLEYAQLQHSFGLIAAPISGLVSRKSVEPGQYVQAGQTLLSIASDTGAWIVANYKETQIGRMRIGQAVQITVDGYPGIVFRGRVESISGATGARFALLPPDNASGNFVKVTQRVPVKIMLTDPPDPQHRLRLGMSVDAAVKIKD